jgi:hypothetical protein
MMILKKKVPETPGTASDLRVWFRTIRVISRMTYWGAPPQQGAGGGVGAFEEQEESPRRAPAAMIRIVNFIFDW